MENANKGKNLSIQTLRGVAIILMVLGHVIGAKSGDGLKVSDDSGWRFFYYSLEFVRMPLFTVISGYVYAYKPLAKFSSPGQFINRKISRLLVPLFVVSTLFYITQFFTPGANLDTNLNDIWVIYIKPYAHFWFLQGMFIVFLIITLLENFGSLNSFKSALMWLGISALIFLLVHTKFNYFSINKVPFLLTFFLVGLILKRFYDLIFKRSLVIVVSVIASICFCWQLYLFNYQPLNPIIESLLTLCIGSSVCIILINLGFESRRLIWLGNFSFGIYLFHIFGTAASRIILIKFGVNILSIQVLVGLICGVTFPILLELLCSHNQFLSALFFGNKITNKKNAQPALQGA